MSNPTNPNPPSNSPTPPTGATPSGNPPAFPAAPPSVPGAAPPGSVGGDLMSNTAWARMFPGGATPQQFRQFINTFMQMMIYQFKQSDEQWQQAQQRLKEVEEGNDPDS